MFQLRLDGAPLGDSLFGSGDMNNEVINETAVYSLVEPIHEAPGAQGFNPIVIHAIVDLDDREHQVELVAQIPLSTTVSPVTLNQIKNYQLFALCGV